MAKGWSLDPAVFANTVSEKVGTLQRHIATDMLNQIIKTSPVGNPDIRKVNNNRNAYNQFADSQNEEAMGFAENLTPTGRLKKSARYVKAALYRPEGYRGGLFKASHFVSIDTPSDFQPLRPDPNGVATMNRGVSTIERAPDFCRIYIQSNLPYSLRLEQGHSTQAPTGVYANAFNGVSQAYK
jgi:hypothetical protein